MNHDITVQETETYKLPDPHNDNPFAEYADMIFNQKEAPMEAKAYALSRFMRVLEEAEKAANEALSVRLMPIMELGYDARQAERIAAAVMLKKTADLSFMQKQVSLQFNDIIQEACTLIRNRTDLINEILSIDLARTPILIHFSDMMNHLLYEDEEVSDYVKNGIPVIYKEIMNYQKYYASRKAEDFCSFVSTLHIDFEDLVYTCLNALEDEGNYRLELDFAMGLLDLFTFTNDSTFLIMLKSTVVTSLILLRKIDAAANYLSTWHKADPHNLGPIIVKMQADLLENRFCDARQIADSFIFGRYPDTDINELLFLTMGSVYRTSDNHEKLDICLNQLEKWGYDKETFDIPLQMMS